MGTERMMNKADYEKRARIIKALGHPSRLMMVDALQHADELCVCDLQQMVGADMSTVSKHLSLLKAAGILKDRKQGLQVYYSLRVPCITGFFTCVEAVLDEERRSLSCTR
jgi:DNA-binding transcriptional ArsR family regulator